MTPLEAFWLWLLGVFCWLLSKAADDVQTFAPAVRMPAPPPALREEARQRCVAQMAQLKTQEQLMRADIWLSRSLGWKESKDSQGNRWVH